MKLTGSQRKQIAIGVLEEIRLFEIEELKSQVATHESETAKIHGLDRLIEIVKSSVTSERLVGAICILNKEYWDKYLKDIEIEEED